MNARRAPEMLLVLALLAGCDEKPAPSAEAAAKPAVSATPAPASAALPTPPPSAAEAPAPAPDPNPPKDAKRTKSGLSMVVLTPGTGKRHPKPKDSVRVRVMGFLPGGGRFGGPKPTTMSMSEVAPGWAEALADMVEGEKRRLWMSPALAFGNAPGAPTANGKVVLELELLGIPEPPPRPKDLGSPPKSAKKTASGLVYEVLKQGTGKQHPTATSQVTVHYSGWTKDGKLFDSSVMRGEPASFALSQVIKGWTEGVALMVVGEKTRFWIPAALAYGDEPSRPGKPAGDLVFDIELLAIR